MSKTIDIKTVLKQLGISEVNQGVSTGIDWFDTKGDVTASYSPIDGKEIGKVKNATLDDYEMVIKKAQAAFKVWRKVPAPHPW